MSAYFHFTPGLCGLTTCHLTGYHFHWRGMVYRSDRELTDTERHEFDADLRAGD